jgi:hypothetical protein
MLVAVRAMLDQQLAGLHIPHMHRLMDMQSRLLQVKYSRPMHFKGSQYLSAVLVKYPGHG